jgi:drug/metabolite transporter (DMT)-like permease
MILLLTLYALFASTFILGEKAVTLVAPIFFVGARMTFAGLLLLGYVAFFTKEKLSLKKEHLWWFVGIILFHIYFSYVLEFISYKYLSGSYVALMYNLSPFITALFAFFFLTEIMTKKKWIGLLIGFFSSLPMIISKGTTTPTLEGISSLVVNLAQISLFLSVIATCIGWIFLKKITTTWGYSYVFVNGFGMFLGGLISFVTSYFIEPWPTAATITGSSFWSLLVASVVIGNVIVYNLYGKLLHRYSTTALSLFGCTTPLFAALIDWLWLGKTVGPLFLITAVATSIGLYIFYQEELAGTVVEPGIVQEQQKDLER